MSAATLAHTGIPAALVPQDLLDDQVAQRAHDALQTVRMLRSMADAQVANLKDVRRNGGLAHLLRGLSDEAAALHDLAYEFELLAASNGGPAR